MTSAAGWLLMAAGWGFLALVFWHIFHTYDRRD